MKQEPKIQYKRQPDNQIKIDRMAVAARAHGLTYGQLQQKETLKEIITVQETLQMAKQSGEYKTIRERIREKK